MSIASGGQGVTVTCVCANVHLLPD
eukprot:SAG31_NODE_9945_length_1207_cov_1.052347_3_plen_24_part_01